MHKNKTLQYLNYYQSLTLLSHCLQDFTYVQVCMQPQKLRFLLCFQKIAKIASLSTF